MVEYKENKHVYAKKRRRILTAVFAVTVRAIQEQNKKLMIVFRGKLTFIAEALSSLRKD